MEAEQGRKLSQNHFEKSWGNSNQKVALELREGGISTSQYKIDQDREPC